MWKKKWDKTFFKVWFIGSTSLEGAFDLDYNVDGEWEVSKERINQSIKKFIYEYKIYTQETTNY